MRFKPLVALAAAAALGIPAAASAAKPADHPSSHGPAVTHAKGKSEANKGKGKAKAKNAVFKGAVVSVDGTTVTVHVDKANRWGRAFKGTDVAFDVSKLKTAPTVAAGDQVLVQARISKADAPPFSARKLNNLSADDDASDDATPEPTPTPEATPTPTPSA